MSLCACVSVTVVLSSSETMKFIRNAKVESERTSESERLPGSRISLEQRVQLRLQH